MDDPDSLSGLPSQIRPLPQAPEELIVYGAYPNISRPYADGHNSLPIRRILGNPASVYNSLGQKVAQKSEVSAGSI